MQCTFTASMLLCACALFGLATFQTTIAGQDPPKPAPTPAPKPEEPDERRPKTSPIRISAVPAADKEKLAKQYEIVTKWLSKDLGRPVEFVPVDDCAAAVAGLAANKIDVAWLDGVSAVQAEIACEKKCWPLLAREQDMKFKSCFIANKKLVDAGTFAALEGQQPTALEQLAAMKPKFAELTFTFGAASSNSGHIMPRYYLEQPAAGIDPEKNFKHKPGYARTGSHATVLANVASGAFDLGVVDSSAWEQAAPEHKAKAGLIFVTPEYMDNCMVVHNRNGPTLALRVLTAFVRLDPKIEEQKAVLEVFGTPHFVRAGPANLDSIRATMNSVKERGIPE